MLDAVTKWRIDRENEADTHHDVAQNPAGALHLLDRAEQLLEELAKRDREQALQSLVDMDQMQEAVAEATAAAYGAAAELLNNAALAELEVNNPQDAELLFHMWKKVKDLTPAAARNWLAQRDREIVARCAKIAKDRWKHWTSGGSVECDVTACEDIADAILKGGDA